jgi:hypothetical protein
VVLRMHIWPENLLAGPANSIGLKLELN